MTRLTFEDGYEVAKLVAKGTDLARLRRIHEILKRTLTCFTDESDERDFMLGLVEGLGEIAKLREEVARLINVAKSLGITIEVNVKYDEET
ncbi:MAG: hypothetical protein N3F04_01955 [Candidatus Nezhaarchaeota archaeon]|nr:hypothetical protein [Candidatus Nezhaarchaeota archaeon]MCX8141542.1 hypothetical protein [Candidatus Nezhaarchaeota archaeon]MDW8049809.1 hypothetical protein [Nitrososphaerota archaeon]